MLLTVYTASLGRYDTPKPPYRSTGTRWIAFADEHWEGWENEVRRLRGTSALAASKYLKLHPHEVLPPHEISLWVDASTQVLQNPLDLLSQMPPECDLMAFPSQFGRKTVWDEATACIKQGKAHPEKVNRQMEAYRRAGFSGEGLFSGGILFRRCSEKTKKFNKLWWQECQKHTWRDMLSGAYAASEAGLQVKILDHSLRAEYFKQSPHRRR